MRISLNVNDGVLQSFDQMWRTEGWESRQEAIVFLMKTALSRGYISKEKADISKTMKGNKE